MRSFFANYEAGGKQAQAQGVSGQDQPTAAQVSPAVIQFISARFSVAFNDLLLRNYLTNYLSQEKKVDGNQ